MSLTQKSKKLFLKDKQRVKEEWETNCTLLAPRWTKVIVQL
jgi:hypothetical protein